MPIEKCTKKELLFCESIPIEYQFEEGDPTKSNIQMTGYSGGMIDHWYWGKFVINVEGIKMAGQRIPLLRDHDTDKPLGFACKVKKVKDEKGRQSLTIGPEGATLLATPFAQEFVSLSKQGFPFQASIYAKPTSVRKFEKPETVEINGQKFKDIDTVWDACELKEVSACVFGYDSKSISSAFTEEIDFETDIINNNVKEEDAMTIELKSIEQFAQDFPELAKQFGEKVRGEITTALSAQFAEEKKALEAKLAESEDTNKSLAKDVAILKEKDMKRDADNVFVAKLSDSTIPVHLHEKVKAMVSYTKFVKEGVLDINAFAEAVVAEIADWEKFGLQTDQKVQGDGTTSRKIEDGGKTAFTDEDVQAAVKRLSKHIVK